MIKTESFGGVIGGFGSFGDFVDLFFGFTTGFSEEHFGAFDGGRLDI